jgi:ribosomal protein S12 methylthiotransferase accessory factor YcaO
MNAHDPMTSEQANAEGDDPWTSFGSYSDADVAAARALLEQASITFHISPDAFRGAPPSLTPHHLWVHDDHAARARSILVPHFQTK